MVIDFVVDVRVGVSEVVNKVVEAGDVCVVVMGAIVLVDITGGSVVKVLHSPHFLQCFHVHFSDQLLLSEAHMFLQRFGSSMTLVVVFPQGLADPSTNNA